ncbi:hypothetical protein DH2020_047298 [Rehmannia glutinosa]|uniref:Protein transport protein sec16 n=1 Tax=Rehmannia glutinosa TaxID=99300 RepID=A0ABR0U9X1_REHGL
MDTYRQYGMWRRWLVWGAKAARGCLWQGGGDGGVSKVELEKQSYCDLKVTNNTEHHVAFKVKTTSPKKYFVRPNAGIMHPWDTCVIRVTLQAQREYPPNMQCKDKFLLQSRVVPPNTNLDELPQDTFNKEAGINTLEECKLRVIYITPHSAYGNMEDGLNQNFDANVGLQRLKDERDAAVRQMQLLQQDLVEDNTDEDFFDKLVNDDDGVDFQITSTSSAGALFSDRNEFDEAKAFANLSINELDNSADVHYDKADSSSHNSVDDLSTEIMKVKQIDKLEAVEDSGNTLVALNSFEFDNLMNQTENEDGAAEVLSDTTVVSKSSGESFSDTSVVSKSCDSGVQGVKEVGWNAFHADSAGNDGNGFGSYSDFFSELGGDNACAFENVVGDSLNNGPHVAIGNAHGSAYMENSDNFGQYSEGYIAADQSSDVQDLNSSRYWENQYPGWKYDPSTGQWYQVDGYDATSVQENVDSNLSSAWGVANEPAEVSYLQQTAQSVTGTVAEIDRTGNVITCNQASQVSDITETSTNWNQVSQVCSGTTNISSDWNHASRDNDGYPPHMVFDPQYPGWYYDTIAQKWETLESYTASVQSNAQFQDQTNRGGYASTDTFYRNNDHKTYNTHDHVNSYNAQGFGSQVQDQNWAGRASNYSQQSSSMWQFENVASSKATPQYSANQQMEDQHGQNFHARAYGNRQDTLNCGVTGSYYENASQGQDDFPMASSTQGFVGRNLGQQFNDSTVNQNDHRHVSNDYYSNQNSVNFSQNQKHFQSTQISYAPAAGRSSAVRPAHALVTFGFGGKLIVLKDNSSTENFNIGSQNPVGGSISVLSLAEVVNHNADAPNHGMGICNYFQALSRQCVPGPLSGGSVGSRELNKWIDERIANSGSADMDYRKAEVLGLLLSLLKIACQYYGKLRSPYGTDAESDAPESAVARLFASAKRNSLQFSQYGAVAQCLQQMPSEGQMRATAAEVQSLLISGRKKEALQCAQEGQMWGPALVLAAQLGDQFYVETIKQMALRQFVVGSPLTLCLLVAGQPAEVFSADSTAMSSMVGAVNTPQQPAQFGANGMLDDWEENLAVITANRTKDDELVLMHLGDCLWKDRSDIIAAHICYLVAEASFESYSDTARMCLVGADHWNFPRTYASPEAIQRTEIYEYSKTLGNSQFVLLPFQPYKLIYAQMLAEVGKMSDALKYCQAVLKSLKTGRTPEVDTLRPLVLSLEERIKSHQQGGFSANLAPKKLVGKLLNLFDSTAHRVVGGMPPPVPTAGGAGQGNENHQSFGPRVSTSQSTMAMSSLVPSESLEPISEWGADNNRMAMHTRSISEPDFGRSPRQKEASSTGLQEKASASGTSRFGRFGFGSQLFQKTVGLVLKPRQDRQAKLGDTNKFYYDEKLKRWVEEGAEPPAEEAALPPPPTTAAVFQNGTSSDYNLKSALQSQAFHGSGGPEYKSPSVVDNNSGIPPLPPTSNQYSARGRMGVRSRYVDTFNKGGGSTTNLFQSPSLPPIKPTSGANPKFFVPTPVSAVEQGVEEASENNTQQDTSSENPSTSPLSDSFHSPAPPSMTMQKFASLNNISNQGTSDNGSFPVQSRRTASWSGSLNNSFMPTHPSLARSSTNGGSFGDDLHEVEL